MGRRSPLNVVLVERNTAARSELGALLRTLGVRAISGFADPEIALRYVLGRLPEVEAVVLNEDEDGATALLRRLRFVRARGAAISTIVYSGRKLAAGPKRGRAVVLERLARAVRRIDSKACGNRTGDLLRVRTQRGERRR